jgi:hypothetical protein
VLAQNYNASGNNVFWDSGDFNNDGAVNFSDLVALAQNYNTAFAGASFESDLAAAFDSTPEPGLGSLPSVCAIAALARRRRRDLQ